MATSSSRPRDVVPDVISRLLADEIWSARYDKALPVTFNAFELSAVLPAVFYMFRFEHRRGRGEFLKKFGPKGGSPRARRRETTIDCVAATLAQCSDLEGFDHPVGRAILGDLLLGFNLENIKESLGRDKQLQRVVPAHYMASWIDLPESSTHLRFVPEMIVAVLANQEGEHVAESQAGHRTWFPVARDHVENPLLMSFSQGMKWSVVKADLAGDKFDDSFQNIDIDQLLMIRLAQQLGHAPRKTRGRGEGPDISNQRPIARSAAEHFSEDIRRFIRSYSTHIPRHVLVGMIESCIATGMTTILTSVIEILFKWADSGNIATVVSQSPARLFVDCSNGVDIPLRSMAERSFDDLMRRFEGVPAILMMLRLLDYLARDIPRVQAMRIQTRPYATEWFDLLGDLLHDRHEAAQFIHEQMSIWGTKLVKELGEDYPEATEMLRNARSEPNPVRRLAKGLTSLLGAQHRRNTISMLDSTLNIERPNGLARKRRTTSGARAAASGRRQREVRSLVLTDPVLDYLVHIRLVRPGNKPGVRPLLSLKEFLREIRERYGFYINAAPPGMTISNDLLRLNCMVLERRLRDLGLLVGVNDAEAMKRLKPRFEPHQLRMDDRDVLE